MADETLQTLPPLQNLDQHVVTLFQHMEIMHREKLARGPMKPKQSWKAELSTLEFWRSTSSEFLTSFLYVFLVCGAAAGAGVGASVSSVLLATALTSGLTTAALTQVFSQLSGAHINPSVTIGMAIMRAISPLRAALYMTAQCGGGFAGAWALYGVTAPGYQHNLLQHIGNTSDTSALGAGERLIVEMIATFFVVLTYMSVHNNTSFYGSSAMAIGAAYTACSFVSMPYMNPARSIGPALVFKQWDNHWVYWVGPLTGGMLAGIVFKYIINPKRNSKLNKTSLDTDSASLQSDDDINYDLDPDNKANGGGMPVAKFHGGPQSYRNGGGQQRGGNGGGNVGNSSLNAGDPRGQVGGEREYCQQNRYNATPTQRVETAEPLYGGTRSMYCKSPPLTRSNLNRSQSVYTKSQTAINRDFGSRPGPLVPAQSLYPMRMPGGAQSMQNGGPVGPIGPNPHLQNQNVQNQMQQRTESIYGVRGQVMKGERPQQQQPPTPQQQQQQHQQQMGMLDGPGFQPVYGTRGNAISMGDGLCNKYGEKDARDMRDDTTNMKMLANPANPNALSAGRPSPHRPESVYGLSTSRRGQSAHSDDSSYGSYHDHPGPSVTPPTRKPPTAGPPNNNNIGPMPLLMQMPLDVMQQHQQQQQQQHQQQQQSNGGAVGYSSQQQQIRFGAERKGSTGSGPGGAMAGGAAAALDARQMIYGTTMKQQQQQHQQQLQQHQQVMTTAMPTVSPMAGGIPPPMPHHQYNLQARQQPQQQ